MSNIKEPYQYTDTNWEDLLDYNGMTWINIDRFKELQQKNKELKEQIKLFKKDLNNILTEFENWLKEQIPTNSNENFVVIRMADIKNKLQKLKGEINEINSW